MKQLKVRDLKRARKQAIKLLREEKLDELKEFADLMKKAEDLYVKGLPIMKYQLKPGLIERHQGFWQKHPVWNECINSITVESHTKTSKTLVIYFRN